MTWIRVMQYMITTSTDRFNEMKDKIKLLRPQQYAGQNITQMVNEFIRLAEELENAGEYDHELTRTMIDNCLHVSNQGDVMGRFNFALQKLHESVDAAIQATKYMAKPDRDAHFVRNDVHFRQVLRKIALVYRQLHDSNKWEPSKLPKDRSALTLVHQSKTKLQSS